MSSANRNNQCGSLELSVPPSKIPGFETIVKEAGAMDVIPALHIYIAFGIETFKSARRYLIYLSRQCTLIHVPSQIRYLGFKHVPVQEFNAQL